MILPTLIALVLGAALIGAAVYLVRVQLAAQSGGAVQEAIASIEKLSEAGNAQIKFGKSYASPTLFKEISDQAATARTELETETNKLKTIEAKLDTAQKDVETRETAHQEIKTAEEEDEAKASAILAEYSGLSTEAVGLEQRLASSMKNLDQIMNEIELSQDQKNVLTELSDSLMNAGSRLRDLLTEYKQVNDRLDMLKQQHVDLEEEYTRLVEQQLGE